MLSKPRNYFIPKDSILKVTLFLILFCVAGAAEMSWNHSDVLVYWSLRGSTFHHILFVHVPAHLWLQDD